MKRFIFLIISLVSLAASAQETQSLMSVELTNGNAANMPPLSPGPKK